LLSSNEKNIKLETADHVGLDGYFGFDRKRKYFTPHFHETSVVVDANY
jgi:hypothetical protein